MTSNYNNQIGNSINEEVFVNGKNSSKQYFYINNEKYKYSIYPVVLENLYGEKEHILSIIYIYRDNLFISKLISDNSSLAIKLLSEIKLFIIFG